ncbi:MAG TPA: radical SAM protein [Pseudonocardia sp.]|uniref:radical SAM protein n=1 Tax=Pseudonocardia sp. TaxID=60912 RepID=UPI002BE67E57|nr:radical SAM protein [Pseudonocardia sp.]HTF47553.1 radical SAM protein [Pseudonocardia sp.]
MWLELTNRCNLHCVHCYTESGPQTGDLDKLAIPDYVSTMHQAFALGCRSMQFIGGEPQLNRDFPVLLAEAIRIGFPFIEVFSNLTFLTEDTLRYAATHGIHFATSVYSDEAAVHDTITGVRGSHTKTIHNLKRLIGAGVTTRAGTIRIDQDDAMMDRTRRFLLDLGVSLVRSSDVREFGRGEKVLGREAQMSGLCGHCWNGKLCVAPDGEVFPCVMARQWPVGNIRQTELADIVRGMPLRHIRREIYETVWLPKIDYMGCTPECPQSCAPDYSSCTPMTCDPQSCPQSCSPPYMPDCTPDLPQ